MGETAEENGAPTLPKKKGGVLAVEKIYQKKTQLEHILLRPDTYIGSIEPVTQEMWVYDSEQEMMVSREVTFVPGLYKIFDEILVNAADNKQRDPKMDTIKITVNPEENIVSVWNNGQGIPVVEHKDEQMYVPTMIFGHLLTSSNYNDEEEKVTGGRNGYGAKLCNVFSTKFTVETASKQYGKAFKQTWTNNMSVAKEVKIIKSSDDYTKVTFSPDLAKFKMEKLDKDIVDLISRRAFDVAASTRGVKVFLNGTRLPVKNFKDYIDLYIKNKEDGAGNPLKVIHESCNERWEIALTGSEKGFQQVSFVNSIATTKGGRHVEYVADYVVKHLIDLINKKNKGGIQIKPFQVKTHMWLFVNCLIVNPTFDSQTKENMTLLAKNFSSSCKISDKFITQVTKSSLIEQVLSWAKYKAQITLDKVGGGKKKKNKISIPKLDDANDAGTKNSLSCTLILTEGDSAKALAVSGLGIVGRDKYGVFPLRGKLLNVREATYSQILQNAEINNLIKIVGLQYHKVYKTTEDLMTLRYGKIMIMTDQDQDGSHIKGLIINFIHTNWPSLIQLPFLEVFITPIVKVTKRNEELSFYSIPEFDEWKSNTANHASYKVKYYKGLGTSTSKEAKEYFSNMDRHRVKLIYSGPECDKHIIMGFSKKCVDDRKEWLTNWMTERKRRLALGLAEEYLYMKDTKSISYKDFINKELVLFSNADNERSIPSGVDGLKPGQRKVLFTCFKRNDKREVKVAQLAGSVAEHSCYHHGEASLMLTIINLAQNFVGTNNINMLQPIGQFGTRLQGGKDAASPRYIFTMLSPLARLIYHPDDDPLLKYQREDNQRIEPVWYIPVIPMVLVNGGRGIGTGWMSDIPNHNPREIIENIKKMVNAAEPSPMRPWYKNFRGHIDSLSQNNCIISGEVGIIDETTVEITELPVGTWTTPYKESVLDAMSSGSDKDKAGLITDFKEYHTDTTVKFVVNMPSDKLCTAEHDGIHKYFKIQTSKTSILCAFDSAGCLKTYENTTRILKEFFDLRLDYYLKRKNYLEGVLQAETDKLTNQARFIVEKCNGTLTVENKKKMKMIEELQTKGFRSDPVKAWKTLQIRQGNMDEEEAPQLTAQEDDELVPSADIALEDLDFDYLLSMTMWSLTLERKEELINKKNKKVTELQELKVKTPGDLWMEDLQALLEKLDEVEEKERKEEAMSVAGASAALKGNKGGRAAKKKCIMNEVMPSADARVILPVINEEMMKKVETAVRLKERKLNGPTVKKERKKPGKETEKDKFDLIEEGVQKSFAQRLGNSPKLIDKNATKKKRVMKQTKLTDKKKSPKKKKGGNPWTSSSEDGSGFDSDEPSVPVEKRERILPRRSTAANIKFNYDSEEIDEFKSGTEDEDDPKPTKTPPTLNVSFSDDEDDLAPEKKESPVVDSDKLFDSLIGNSSSEKINLVSDTESKPAKGKGKAKPAAAAKKKPAATEKKPAVKRPKKKALSSDNSDDEDMFAVGKKDKKKKKNLDSDDDMSVDVEPVPPRSNAGRAKKAISYTLSEDDDSF